MRFTLKPDRWYACELIGDEFDEDLCSYSPIRIHSLSMLGTGSRLFELHFYHANYPEGVRDKTYKLETIERGAKFLLSKSRDHDPVRFLKIYDIDWSWLCRRGLNNIDSEFDVQTWLDRNYLERF